MSYQPSDYKFVDYLWNHEKAAQLKSDEPGLLVYRSNILGADLRVTNFAGGNTSCKCTEKDPLTAENVEVMWVKGSGGDIGSMTKKGLASIYLEKLHSLKKQYRGLQFEDEMVAKFKHCIFNLNPTAPSIDTPLHGFLPYKHIDHLHPDAIIAIAAAKDGEQITADLFEGELGWIPWQRPGFDLGLRLEKAVTENPNLKGLVLGGHGLFSWGETSFECYETSLEIIEKAARYLDKNMGKSRPVFGGIKREPLSSGERLSQASALMPVLRGLCSSENLMVGHFTDDDRVLEFINSNDLDELAPLGTSCPDHFLRTKIRPLVLEIEAGADLTDANAIKAKMEKAFADYRADYTAYYNRCKFDDSPALRDPNPVVILWPGVGMFTFAKNKQTARVSSEFYINAINVMKGAEAVSKYCGLAEQEAFNIEYWLLEEAKLQRLPKENSLARKVALVTGAAGGIGKAIAHRFLEESACVILADVDENALKETTEELAQQFGKDVVRFCAFDVSDSGQVATAFEKTMLEFGGIDILVNSAGLARAGALQDTSEKDWDLLQDVMVKGQFLLSKAAVEIMRKQGRGGSIVNVVSKNALVAGPNNVAYGTAKAAQLHQSRLLAAELGPDKITVNVVNPDAVIQGSRIWSDGWAAGRAKAYGISEEELPAHYAKRTLLNEQILPEDVAEAVFVFVCGCLSKCTGNVLNVDGGVAAAFVR